MNAPGLEFFCRIDVELAAPIEMGAGRAGTRRIVPIVGGTVSGPRIEGRVLDLGADWQTVFAGGGLAELDTRYAMETSDGAVIDIRNYGFRHASPETLSALMRGDDVAPEAYYMRTHARLESGDERYAHLNRTLFVGTGARSKAAVVIELYAIL